MSALAFAYELLRLHINIMAMVCNVIRLSIASNELRSNLIFIFWISHNFINGFCTILFAGLRRPVRAASRQSLSIQTSVKLYEANQIAQISGSLRTREGHQSR